jgi:hypothetical protein
MWAGLFSLIAVAIVVLVFFDLIQRRWTAVAMIVGVLITSYLPIFGKEYRITANALERQREWDIYHGAVFLQEFINSQVPTSRTVGFWYSNFELLMYSVQSMFLWEYTRVAPADQGHPGMPMLDERTRAAMVKKNFLALLGTSKTETDDAVTAVVSNLPFRVVSRAVYSGRTWGFNVALLKAFSRSLGTQLFEVPLSRLVPVHGSRVTAVGNGTRLITGGQQWGYSLVGPLRGEGESSAAGRAVVRVELQVEEGTVGIALEDANDRSKLFEVSAGESSGMETVDIEVPDLASTAQFIVRNYRAAPSTATIRSIQVFRASY